MSEHINENKNTSYNRLTQLFGQKSDIPNPNNPQDVLKADNDQEFHMKRLEKHQSMYLQKMGGKLNQLVYNTTLSNDNTRLAAYRDFEQMEYYPSLARALDIYAEEATTKDEKGKLLNIFSENERVKHILEDLFYERLHIQTNLPLWTRCTCKYGDNFVFLETKDTQGIVGCKQLPNVEIERTDGGLYDNKGVHQSKMTKFKWRSGNFEMLEWQIAHFRLLFDDRRIPYGVSMLEKCRRIWKNLLIAEDSMLTYRVIRAADRHVFKIFVGNINPTDVDAYVNKVVDGMKRRPINQMGGQYNSRYNVMSIADDFVIPIRKGDTQSSIETLAGATNMSEIADIEYLEKQIYTALGIPAQYLNYGSDSTGGNEGKNLAMMDIRLARTINRIQEALLMTLNKIAITHLFLLGLEDELGNFSLSLNNPSIQTELMRVEYMTNMMTLFRDATTKNDNGFSPFSTVMAMQKILGLSEEETMRNIEQQRLEAAAKTQLEATSEVIKNSGYFDNIDKLYGDPTKALADISSPSDDIGGDIGGGGGDFDLGGDDFGGGDSEFATDGGADVGGDENVDLGESKEDKKENIITEKKYSAYAEKLKESGLQKMIVGNNVKVQENINSMLDELENFKKQYDRPLLEEDLEEE